MTPLQTPVNAHAAVAISNTHALICGGYGSHDNITCETISDCYIYDSASDTISRAKDMLLPRFGHNMLMFQGLYVWKGNSLCNL